jgi:glycosidase
MRLFALLGALGSLLPSMALCAQSPVFYEVNLRAMSTSGDLVGAERHLPEIQRLGANVVWLMPIYPSGNVRSVGSPYAVADYTQVNPEFGNFSDLKAFVARAHRLGMEVILDWVANHTAWGNPWINEHPDWYLHGPDGEIEIPPKTNWQDVAQLDHRNPEMRAEMAHDMERWVDEANVDGFRCDAADFVPGTFWKPLVQELRSHSHKKLLLLAEGSRMDHYTSGFDYLYAWDFCTALKEVLGGGKPASRLKAALTAERDQPRMHYVTNHDEYVNASPINIFGSADAAFAAFALAALYGGNPLIYDGQEISWPDPIPFFSKSHLDWNTGQATEARFTKLLALLDGHPCLQQGALKEFGNDDVIALSRTLGSESFTVLVNVRGSRSDLRLGEKTITLAPFEVRISPGLAP